VKLIGVGGLLVKNYFRRGFLGKNELYFTLHTPSTTFVFGSGFFVFLEGRIRSGAGYSQTGAVYLLIFFGDVSLLISGVF